MSRDLSAAFIAQLEAVEKTVAVFYEAEFASGMLYLWSGYGDIDWNGQTWVGGAGALVKFSQITETSEVRADGIICTLSGITESFRSLVLSEVQQGKPGIVYIGFLDDAGDVIPEAVSAFDGRLDVPTMKDSGKDIVISLSYETRLRDLERAREQRYTNESQALVDDSDIGFEYVPSLQQWSGVWGRA